MSLRHKDYFTLVNFKKQQKGKKFGKPNISYALSKTFTFVEVFICKGTSLAVASLYLEEGVDSISRNQYQCKRQRFKSACQPYLCLLLTYYNLFTSYKWLSPPSISYFIFSSICYSRWWPWPFWCITQFSWVSSLYRRYICH